MPVVFTIPKAAISGLSVVGSSFVTTSPFSTAASCASSSWITLRRNGRGGGSCAAATAGSTMASTQDKQAFNTPLRFAFILSSRVAIICPLALVLVSLSKGMRRTTRPSQGEGRRPAIGRRRPTPSR